MIIDDIIESSESGETDNTYELFSLDSIVQDHEEIIFYLDDLMQVNPAITPRVIDAFINECLSPAIQTLSSPKKLHFGIKMVIFVCAVLMRTTTIQDFAEAIIIALFGRYYSRDLSLKFHNPSEKLLSYNKQWKFKGFWDSHEEKINDYCTRTYHP